MTRKLAVLAIVSTSILVSGCFVALHPLVTPDVRVYEPALVGTWQEPGDTGDAWSFKPEPAEHPEGYLVEITEHHRNGGEQGAKPLTATFDGKLGRFGDVLVLDLQADQDRTFGPLKDHGMLTVSLVPAHVLFRVKVADARLVLSGIDPKWLDRAIAEKKVTIAHEHIGSDDNPHDPGKQDSHSTSGGSEDWILLTAPTRDLQALVRTHGKAGLFQADDDSGVLVRKGGRGLR